MKNPKMKPLHNVRPSHRVVITGIGVISSIGTGRENFWENLLKGVNGIKYMPELDQYGVGINVGGKVMDFNPENYIPESRINHYGRTSQLGISSSILALKDAGLTPKELPNNRTTILIGTTMGECNVQESMVKTWITNECMSFNLSDILKVPDCQLAFNIAKELELECNCMVIPTACAAGNYAISHGFDLIRNGEVDVALAGGCDAFSNIAFMGFSRLLALTKDKCKPFDKNRNGIGIGEGSGIFILESLENALNRNANIYAEMLGYGLSCDAHHMTIPHGDGVVSVMKNAIRNAELTPDDIDLICAHGTGTRMNDKTECGAIIELFGNRGKTIPVNSIKSMLGHTMGAASALEAISCILSISDKKVAPTIHYETPDEDCPINCIPNEMQEHDVSIALNNSFAFGGNNAATIFSAFSE